MSRRAHGNSGVSEERPRRATTLPRSSDRRLTAWSQSTHGALVACNELSLRIDGVHTACTVHPMRFYGVYTECRWAYQKKRSRHIAKLVMHMNGSWVIILLIFVDVDNKLHFIGGSFCVYSFIHWCISIFNAGEDGHITAMLLAISEIVQ